MTTTYPLTQFWYQAAVPARVQDCAQSWSVDPRFDVRFFGYQDALSFTRTHGTPEQFAALKSCVPNALISDYFRLLAVRDRGGAYVDANWAQVKPFADIIDRVRGRGHAGLLYAVQNSVDVRDSPDVLRQAEALGVPKLLNGFFYFDAPQSPFLDTVLEVSTRSILRRSSENIMLVASGFTFSAVLALREFETRAQYIKTFQGLAGVKFEGVSIAPVIDNVLEVVAERDFDALRAAFKSIRVNRAAQITGTLKRSGLGRKHKAHWLQHQGSLYRPDSQLA